MRITIRIDFKLNEPNYETNARTVRELFEELSNKYKNQPDVMEFYDYHHKKVVKGCQVLLNSQNYSSFKDRLDTELKEGDVVEGFFLMMGG